MFHRQPRGTPDKHRPSRFFSSGGITETATIAKAGGGGGLVLKHFIKAIVIICALAAATLMSSPRLSQQISPPLQQQEEDPSPSSLPNLLVANSLPEGHQQQQQQQQQRQLGGRHPQQNEQQQQRRYDVSCPHPCIIEYDTATNEAIQLEPTGFGDDYYDDDTIPEGADLPMHLRVKLAESTPLKDRSEDDDGCRFINPRHDLFFPTSNNIHEIDFTSLDVIFINCGGARCAFYFPDSGHNHKSELEDQDDDNDSNRRTIVLKTQKWKKEFESKRSEKARKDGLIMEQATPSPFVMDVFAITGTSQLLDYSPRGSLHDHIKLTRQKGQDDMDPVDKLKILIHIASAVTAIHNHTSVGVAHGDLCCHQFLWKDGYYKLNDFHMSSFLREDSKTNALCMGQNSVANHEMLWRAPEEKARKALDQEKVDVYMMGMTMYYVYTKNWLYEGIPEKEALALFHKNHTTSAFPSHLHARSNVANSIMQSAIEQCWRYQPKDRPSAMKIRDYLLRGLTKILQKQQQEAADGTPTGEPTTIIDVNDAVLRVEIPPLPNGYRFTGSSMDNANDNPIRKPPKHIRYRENN